ncbi:WD40 repeat domain-containing protein [Nostoc sp.]|uniref:WD40 repeat domain-containing protein n=1 Tax=Nostoc sp. TaxID=1180 RepID=UPI002FFB699D
MVEAVEVKTNLLLKVKSWINKNKWILITGTGAASVLISLQIYAYTKYKDFTFFNPILLIQRIFSSSFLERNILGNNLGYSSIKFSSNGTIFSSENEVWDFHSGKKLKSFSVENLRPPTSRKDEIIAINLDIKFLVSRHDEEIKVWNIDNNQLMRTVPIGDHKHKIRNIMVTKNSEYLLVFYSNRSDTSNYESYPKINLYDLKNGKLIRSFADESGFAIPSISLLHVSDDGKIIIITESVYKDSLLKIWNIRTGKNHIVERTRNEEDWNISVINSDVTQNLLRTKRSSYLEVRRLDTGKLISVTESYCEVSDSSELKADKISPDGKFLVNVDRSSSDYNDFTIQVCDLTNGERVHISKIADSLDVEFSTDSKILAISERDSQNKTINLYNLKTGKIDQSFIDAPSLGSTLAFTPDGRFLLTGSKNGIRIWRIR